MTIESRLQTQLRAAWEEGFRLCRSYGDNHAHFQGDQKERQWKCALAILATTTPDASLEAAESGSLIAPSSVHLAWKQAAEQMVDPTPQQQALLDQVLAEEMAPTPDASREAGATPRTDAIDALNYKTWYDAYRQLSKEARTLERETQQLRTKSQYDLEEAERKYEVEIAELRNANARLTSQVDELIHDLSHSSEENESRLRAELADWNRRAQPESREGRLREAINAALAVFANAKAGAGEAMSDLLREYMDAAAGKDGMVPADRLSAADSRAFVGETSERFDEIETILRAALASTDQGKATAEQ